MLNGDLDTGYLNYGDLPESFEAPLSWLYVQISILHPEFYFVFMIEIPKSPTGHYVIVLWVGDIIKKEFHHV